MLYRRDLQLSKLVLIAPPLYELDLGDVEYVDIERRIFGSGKAMQEFISCNYNMTTFIRKHPEYRSALLKEFQYDLSENDVIKIWPTWLSAFEELRDMARFGILHAVCATYDNVLDEQSWRQRLVSSGVIKRMTNTTSREWVTRHLLDRIFVANIHICSSAHVYRMVKMIKEDHYPFPDWR